MCIVEEVMFPRALVVLDSAVGDNYLCGERDLGLHFARWNKSCKVALCILQWAGRNCLVRMSGSELQNCCNKE